MWKRENMTCTSVALLCVLLSAFVCVVSPRSTGPVRDIADAVTSEAQTSDAEPVSSQGGQNVAEAKVVRDCNVIPLRLCSGNDTSPLCRSIGLIREAICERAGVQEKLLAAANETFKTGVKDDKICADGRFGISKEMGQLLPELVENFIEANGSRCKEICTLDVLFIDNKCKAFHAALQAFVSIVELTASGGVQVENSSLKVEATTQKTNAISGKVENVTIGAAGGNKSVSVPVEKANSSANSQTALVNVTKPGNQSDVREGNKVVKEYSLKGSTVGPVLSPSPKVDGKQPELPAPPKQNATEAPKKVAQSTESVKTSTLPNEATEGDVVDEYYDMVDSKKALDDRAHYPAPDTDGGDAAEDDEVVDKAGSGEDKAEDQPKMKPKIEDVSKPGVSDQDYVGGRYGFGGRRHAEVEAESSFVTYLGMLLVGGGLGYFAFINRHKVLALMVEGSRSRTSSERRRTGSGAKYHKLDNLEDTLRRTHDKESDDKHVVF